MTLSLLKRKSNEILICSWSISCSWNFNKQTKTVFLVLFLHSNTKNNSDCLLSTFRLANAYEWVRGRRIWSYMYLSQDLNRRGKWHAPVWKKPATRTWTINSIAVLLIQYICIHEVVSVRLDFCKFKKKTNRELVPTTLLNNFKGCLNS